MRVEHAQISLLGARETNQDRVSVVVSDQAALLIACDGMGGHAEGERAAVLAQALLTERFNQTPHPLFDPLGFLHLVIGAAHQKVVMTGAGMPLETRPRATCAVCLVQQRSAYWAHVGDSRIYHLRGGRMVTRTRDHSHVEVLLREGLITESCLGGESLVPEMSLSRRQPLQAGDVLLVCTDGLWANLDDASIAAAFAAPDTVLLEALQRLSERAVAHGGAGSDNTSSAVLRFLE